MPGGRLGTERPLGQIIRSVLDGHWLASAQGCAGVPSCITGGSVFETVPVVSSLEPLLAGCGRAATARPITTIANAAIQPQRARFERLQDGQTPEIWLFLFSRV